MKEIDRKIEETIKNDMIGCEEDIENYQGSLMDANDKELAKQKIREERNKSVNEILDIDDKKGKKDKKKLKKGEQKKAKTEV